MPKQADQRELVQKVGGVFRLCSMVQKRMRELVMGARPMVEVDYTQRRDLLEIVMREIDEGKIDVAEEGEIPVDIPMLQTDVAVPTEESMIRDALTGVVDEDDLAVVAPAPEESQDDQPEASDVKEDDKDKDGDKEQPEKPAEEPTEKPVEESSEETDK